MEDLIAYLSLKRISFKEVDSNHIQIDEQIYQLITIDKGEVLFDEKFHFIVDEDIKAERIVYRFGGKWYWDEVRDLTSPQLHPLLYLGKSNDRREIYLGVRGGSELLNGSMMYRSWVKKASFLQTTHLGICEKNTLSGLLKFQFACRESSIKPILGVTYTIYRKIEDLRYDIKLYVQDEQGWQSILRLNKSCLVDNDKYIEEEDLEKNLKGLFIILDPKSLQFERKPLFLNEYTSNLYFQLDSVIYNDDERDREYLINLSKYISSEIPPCSITDSFYLEREDSYIKDKLNLIGGFKEYSSSNQHFKGLEEYRQDLSPLFNGLDINIYSEKAILNEKNIASACNFEIDISKRHLPCYNLTPMEEKIFKTSENLFWDLIEKGLRKKIKGDLTPYITRIGKEYNVIMKGGVLDYFLILWDIINWARSQDILVGIGRGSGGGSLIAYLLDIIQVDPLQYDLLFERFLTPERAIKSLPDLDIDFAASKRDLVKHYMEERYGQDQVCSIGTYTTFQLKAAIKDLAREYQVDIPTINYINAALEDLKKDSFAGFFKNACMKSAIKSFTHKYPQVIRDVEIILGQPKSSSVHPCATIIFPVEKTIYEWIPVKKVENKLGEYILVSEWEGEEIDRAGFLKEDILGIQQLDKFQDILTLIKENTDQDINIYDLYIEDKEVFRFFQNGWNGDVFHFGSRGLTKYCRQLQPETIHDLIAGIALYRPGAMESNFHNEYIYRKNGDKEIEYFWGLEEITKETYGLIVYQEQIMKACVEIGGFTLVEADDIRKAMGKKKMQLLHSYKEQFIEGAIKRGCEEEVAENLWTALEKFAEYGFNKSHATAYSLTGYISQYLKVHYPIEYWTIALKYGDEKTIPNYISEINQTGKIKIKAPDINKSSSQVITDFKSETIFWSLTSIKGVGEKASEEIMNERNSSGQYFSFEDFLSRHSQKGSKVNKTVIESLVTCGCFDDVELIESPKDRIKLINLYRDKKHVKVDESKDKYTQSKDIHTNWWWLLKQKELSGFALFDYETLCYFYLSHKIPFFNESTFFDEDSSGSSGCIGGYVAEVEEREISKGTMLKLTLESNFTFINVIIWPEQFDQFSIDSSNLKGKIVLISGKIVYDMKYRKENSLQTFEKSEFVILS